MDSELVRKRIEEHGRWFHEIELAPGIVTPGEDSNRLKLPILDEIGLPSRADGLKVLDVGCSDGYFSFGMERRGASVVAMDFVLGNYTGFEVAKKILGSDARYVMDNVYNLSPEKHGTFELEEAGFSVEEFRIHSMGGYVRARAVHDEEAERYARSMSGWQRPPSIPLSRTFSIPIPASTRLQAGRSRYQSPGAPGSRASTFVPRSVSKVTPSDPIRRTVAFPSRWPVSSGSNLRHGL